MKWLGGAGQVLLWRRAYRLRLCQISSATGTFWKSRYRCSLASTLQIYMKSAHACVRGSTGYVQLDVTKLFLRELLVCSICYDVNKVVIINWFNFSSLLHKLAHWLHLWSASIFGPCRRDKLQQKQAHYLDLMHWPLKSLGLQINRSSETEKPITFRFHLLANYSYFSPNTNAP